MKDKRSITEFEEELLSAFTLRAINMNDAERLKRSRIWHDVDARECVFCASVLTHADAVSNPAWIIDEARDTSADTLYALIICPKCKGIAGEAGFDILEMLRDIDNAKNAKIGIVEPVEDYVRRML